MLFLLGCVNIVFIDNNCFYNLEEIYVLYLLQKIGDIQ